MHYGMREGMQMVDVDEAGEGGQGNPKHLPVLSMSIISRPSDIIRTSTQSFLNTFAVRPAGLDTPTHYLVILKFLAFLRQPRRGPEHRPVAV